ncbi:MAG: helix-turn-helix domain-containing protein [Desulfovibrio sp.]|uniref:helix-turn-helix transcriptional regulator n=1 Tax=Desulfovibrio sp. TaxID=885 RepID=UPI002587FD05|nr:helix-turn-helix domain-containing protein [Desulfovibrio sp.]MCD7984832.1 helix-turn-helix domain-containing protein [Desulfovibrio sp.]
MNHNHIQRRINTAEAAEYLGVRPGTMEVWRSLGKGPRYIKLGARVVYEIADLDAFAASRVVETSDTATILHGGTHA